jgi:hypothetical protein
MSHRILYDSHTAAAFHQVIAGIRISGARHSQPETDMTLSVRRDCCPGLSDGEGFFVRLPENYLPTTQTMSIASP